MNHDKNEPKRQGDEKWTTTMFNKRAHPFHIDFNGDNFNYFVVVPAGTSGKCRLTNDLIASDSTDMSRIITYFVDGS